MKIAAIIPSGGMGLRMGGTTPKPYLKLINTPILVHTLQLFQKSEFIDDIYLVVQEQDICFVEQEIILSYSLTKVRKIISGGNERQDSVYQALKHMKDEHEIVVVHDGVRPLLDRALLERIITVAKKEGAAIAGVPVKDTIKAVDAPGNVEMTLDRAKLYVIQTPQAFKREIILDAYAKAYLDQYYGTDDASLVERMGKPVKVVMGNYHNIKITTPDDILYAEAILRKRGK